MLRPTRQPRITLGGWGAVLAACGTSLALAAGPAYAAAGGPDTTFSGDGKKMTDFFGGSDEAEGVAVQPDGKTVVAGQAGTGGQSDFALARYKQNGALDDSFSGDGRATADFSGAFDAVEEVALQPDGKIVVVGGAPDSTGDTSFAIARFTPNGELDDSFSGDGKARSDFAGAEDVAESVALQPDGKIVVSGAATNTAGNQDFALARYNPNGSHDSTFSRDGRTRTDFAGGSDEAEGIAVQPDGRIVAAGAAEEAGETDFALARYDANGRLDESFAGDGKTTTEYGGFDKLEDVALQPDGKIVAAGFTDGAGTDFALARYTPGGVPDDTFSGDGKTKTDFAGGDDEGKGIALQPDGKIVATGVAHVAGNDDFALARYRPNGALDDGFGTGGKTTTDFAEEGDEGEDVALGPAGKIVVAGTARRAGNSDFGVARYLGGG